MIANVGWDNAVKHPSPADFVVGLTNRTIKDVTRRAKYLIFHLSGVDPDILIVHLGMSGRLQVHSQTRLPDPMTRHAFSLDDGRELRFVDGRKFGKMWLVNDPADVLPDLSPEPLTNDFTTSLLVDSLTGRTAPIKALLLEQSVTSGVGNLYADESLFLAGIHPERPASGLTLDEIARLREAIVTALTAAFEAYDLAREQHWPDPPAALTTWTHPRDTNAQCPNCATNMAATRVRGRSTYFCPTCQG